MGPRRVDHVGLWGGVGGRRVLADDQEGAGQNAERAGRGDHRVYWQGRRGPDHDVGARRLRSHRVAAGRRRWVRRGAGVEGCGWHPDGGPARVPGGEAGAGGVVRRGGGARVLRRAGAAPGGDAAGDEDRHQRPRQELVQPKGPGHADLSDAAPRRAARVGDHVEGGRGAGRHHEHSDARSVWLPRARLQLLRQEQAVHRRDRLLRSLRLPHAEQAARGQAEGKGRWRPRAGPREASPRPERLDGARRGGGGAVGGGERRAHQRPRHHHAHCQRRQVEPGPLIRLRGDGGAGNPGDHAVAGTRERHHTPTTSAPRAAPRVRPHMPARNALRRERRR